MSSEETHPQNVQFIAPVHSDIPPQEFARYVAASHRLTDTAVASGSHSVVAGKQYLNALILANSPYLIKHATNPINWQTWSPEVMQRAKNQNKLVFLSVGFLTCYWCQVMEKESFVDTGIATILNRDFISIKVDRESNPELDQYLISALQQAKGTAGWPVTAILSSDGNIVFIDSYLAKQKLASVLSNMAQVWQNQPQRLISQSKLFARLLKKQDLSTHQDAEPVDIANLVGNLKQHLDMQNGGLSGSPKFPEATLLYLLLDQLQREPYKDVARFVKLQLQNMASKGMYDAIHGGFHRYVADDAWRIPHYEKMLYTQALMIQIYSRAYALFPDPLYEQVVQETLIFLNRYLATANQTFYSGLDAVYQGGEGGYYLYNQSEIDTLNMVPDQQDNLGFYQKGGLVGIYAGEWDAQALKNARKWAIPLRDKTRLQRDNKVITSWNALLISALHSAWLAFGDEVYRHTALQTGEALYQMQVNDNLLYRVWYDEHRGQLATLEDYAFFIRGLLDLYDSSQDHNWLDKAKALMTRAVQTLATAEKGFRYSNNETLTVSSMSLQDGELLNPQAVMLENIIRLNARTGSQSYKNLQLILTQQLSAQINKTPLSQFYAAKVIGDIRHESIASIRYFANGHGRIQLTSQSNQSWLFKVTMDKHWHVNSHEPFTEELIATSIGFPKAMEYETFYPQPTTLQFGPSKTPISVFQQAFTIVVNQEASAAAREKSAAAKKKSPTTEATNTERLSMVADVVLQACNDEQSLCLAPEKIRLFSGKPNVPPN